VVKVGPAAEETFYESGSDPSDVKIVHAFRGLVAWF
jgi:hypothetical protein